MISVLDEGAVRTITMDDGGVNVFTPASAAALRAHVEEAEVSPALSTLVIRGTAKALSVGLDTKAVLAGGPEGTALLENMGAVLRCLYLSRLRSVVVARGHATAAGAMLLLVADHRIGVRGAGKIGLSEVRVGLDVPPLTQQLVRDRLTTPQHYAATALAQLYDYDGALAAGYIDALHDSEDTAMEAATTQAETLAVLNEDAYLKTKLGMRRAFAKLAEG